MNTLEDNIFRVSKASGAEPPSLALLQEIRQCQKTCYSLQSEKISVVKECQLLFGDYMQRLDEEMIKFAKEFPNGIVPELEDHPMVLPPKMIAPAQSSRPSHSSHKKKRVESMMDEDTEDDMEYIIPKAPDDKSLYCICRKVSYGDMIGCDEVLILILCVF